MFVGEQPHGRFGRNPVDGKLIGQAVGIQAIAPFDKPLVRFTGGDGRWCAFFASEGVGEIHHFLLSITLERVLVSAD